uniref:GB1/RHD3-type G domain-containing protein n=1 Tax=Alexandrium monilatum TaxID=311494 RepID=A0A7S4SEG1_9DINO|mmetsp:Transcript_36021/g.111970  ORF Transcript_36021/g.111970 Transcript_36021/m.111970 type:complete len:570 (+) Transcript_36021:48-1757(+)
MASMETREARDSSAAYCSGPLQFIRIDAKGACHLEANAASLLCQIEGRLAVVGIAGLYRTGKSFLLNRLLGLQDGFEIGPSVNPCTKGLWIWGQPVQIEPDFHCIYIDTEGLGSTQRTASCDMQIFSLCILLSSYFIYNSMGAIDEQAVDDLHLVLNLARHLHQRSGQDGSAMTTVELAQFFPSFLWALRDFHLEPMDEMGAPLTEKGYLESALKPMPGQDDKNKLREAIKDLFHERTCVTLPRPCNNEADLRQIQKMPYESLRPQFRKKVESFVTSIYGSLKPKTLRGNHVSGAMFVALASEYCKSINSSGVPTIQSAWSSVIQHQLRLSLHDATKVYETTLEEKGLRCMPMKEEELKDIHKSAKADAMKVFLAPKFDANDPRFLEHREELALRIKQSHEHARMENRNSSQRLCEECARELYARQIAPKLEPPGAYERLEQLIQDWEIVQTHYNKTAAGPAQAEVLSRLLVKKMAESTQRVWMTLQERNNAQLHEVKQRLMKEEATSAERTRLLEEAERRWYAKQSDLHQQLELSRQSLDRCGVPPEATDGLVYMPEHERHCAVCTVA